MGSQRSYQPSHLHAPSFNMLELRKVAIDCGSEFRQSSNLNNSTANSFLPVAQFPTVAHIDLLHHGLIPDPYIDDNETKCLWVNDADWAYRTRVPQKTLPTQESRCVLVFQGLDTVMDVFLDGELILCGKNMHIEYCVHVTKQLQEATRPLSLELQFKAAPKFSRAERSRIGYKGNETNVHFDGPERFFLRKAQYH